MYKLCKHNFQCTTARLNFAKAVILRLLDRNRGREAAGISDLAKVLDWISAAAIGTTLTCA